MAKYMETDELFTLTKQGLAFYEDFFAMKYPFGKYDQLFVPEFNQVSIACFHWFEGLSCVLMP